VVAGVLAVPAAGVFAVLLESVAGGTVAVPGDATEVVPPKSPMSLANAAFRSASVSAETLDGLFAASEVVPLLPKSLMSAVSSAMRPR